MYLLNKSVKNDKGTILIFSYFFLIYNFLNFQEASGSEIMILVQVPVILYVLANLSTFHYKRVNVFNSGFLIFLVCVLLINIPRLQFDLVLGILVDVLPIYVLITKRNINFSTRSLNTIFLIQIIIAIFSYYANINQYGFLPGQSRVFGFDWKVSLFSYLTPPYTGAFSSIIFIVNAENYKTSKNKRVTLLFFLLSLYFIFFAGSRTIFMIVGFYFIFLFFTRFYSFQYTKRFYLILPIAFLILIVSFSLLGGLNGISGGNSFINSVFFRNMQNRNYSGVEDIDRFIMWKQYLQIFSDNWVIGAGKVDKSDFYQKTIGFSETLIPMMFAFLGIIYFVFLYSIFKLSFFCIKHNARTGYLLIVSYLILCAFYGSFMRGYSLVYILIFILISSNISSVILPNNKSKS